LAPLRSLKPKAEMDTVEVDTPNMESAAETPKGGGGGPGGKGGIRFPPTPPLPLPALKGWPMGLGAEGGAGAGGRPGGSGGWLLSIRAPPPEPPHAIVEDQPAPSSVANAAMASDD